MITLRRANSDDAPAVAEVFLASFHATYDFPLAHTDDEVRGWVGMAATLAFAALYLSVFVAMRWRRTFSPFRAPLGAPQGVARSPHQRRKGSAARAHYQ